MNLEDKINKRIKEIKDLEHKLEEDRIASAKAKRVAESQAFEQTIRNNLRELFTDVIVTFDHEYDDRAKFKYKNNLYEITRRYWCEKGFGSYGYDTDGYHWYLEKRLVMATEEPPKLYLSMLVT